MGKTFIVSLVLLLLLNVWALDIGTGVELGRIFDTLMQVIFAVKLYVGGQAEQPEGTHNI